MSLIDKQLTGEVPKAGTMVHGITGGGVARPVLVNDDGTVNVTGGGGGVEYTEDAAAAANPTGGAQILVRTDTPATQVSADGDNIAQRGTNYGAAYVQLVTSTGSYIDSVGGGTQYTEGDTDATITGTAMMMEGAGNALVAAQGTAADGLLVNLGSNNDVTVTGSVTANAGTNLNTSALNLEATQSDVRTSVQLIDDTVATTGSAIPSKGLAVSGTDGTNARVLKTDTSGELQVAQGTATNLKTQAESYQGGTAVGAANPLQVSLANTGANATAVAVSLSSVPSHAVTNAGTFATQSTLQTGDNTVGRVKLTDGTDVVDVLDLTNSNPLTVALVDTNGDQISSFGGGTQYTEDAAAAANPVGTAPMLVRTDTPAGQVSADGDNVAQRGTNYGAAYVQVVTSAGAYVDTFGGGSQYTEDAAAAADPVGTALNLVRKDTPATITSADGDNVAARGSNYGALYTTLVDNTGNFVSVGGGTQYDEDTVSSAADKLNMAGVVRKDTAATLVDTDGDRTQMQVDATGYLWTRVGAALPSGTNNIGDVDVLTVPAPLSTTGGGTEATALRVTIANDSTGVLSVDDNGSTISIDDGSGSITVDGSVSVTGSVTANAGTNLNTSALALESGGNLATIASAVRAEDSVSADADKGIAAFAVRKATPANTSGTDGDYEALQMSAGRLWTSATIDAALPAGTNAIGKLSANSGVDIGDVDITSEIPGTGATNLGKAEDAAHTTGDTGVAVWGVRNDAQTGFAGTDGDYSPIAVDAAGNVMIGGNVAHDAADAKNPVKIGAKAETSPKGITTVADGDRTDLYADADGLLMVKLNTSYADLISERVSDTGGTSTAFTNFTAVVGTKNYVTTITIHNSSSTNGYVDFRDGAAGSVLWTMPIPANGGSVLASAVPIFKTSANTALAYDVSGALTTVYISVSGFQSKI